MKHIKYEDLPLVELLIQDDNDPTEGVQAIAHVDNPAIGVNGYFFSGVEKFVEPNPGETEEEFMSRCIAYNVNEGKDQDQAAAICYSIANEHFCKTGEMDEHKVEEAILRLAEILGEVATPQFDEAAAKLENFGLLDYLLPGSTVTKTGRVFTTRYKYVGNIIPTSREFCRKMLALNKLYSKSEIDYMSTVVGPYIPRPKGSPVDVFTYKGGANCRHRWTEVVYETLSDGTINIVSVKPAPGLSGEVNPPAEHFTHVFASEEKRIVAAPVMIPDMHILRQNEDGSYYNCFFSSDTIRRLSEKYFKELRINMANEMHDSEKVVNVTMLESWIVEDSEKDKSSIYGFNLPVGTWFALFRINDDKLWKEYKKGTIRGLSIEGQFYEKQIK